MDYPVVESYSEIAISTVVRAINQALWTLKQNPPLDKLVALRTTSQPRYFNDNVLCPKQIIPNSEKFIKDTIERIWKIEKLIYYLKYLKYTCDATTQYYYFEAIFSRPTRAYPIPQTTASVYFTVRVSLIHGSLHPPKMSFRLEGHHSERNIRHAKLVEEWLFDVLEMKRKLYSGVERLNVM